MEPLAAKMRPKTIKDVVGQDHLVGENGILLKMIEKEKPLSFILHGAPGTGKTTIANIFANTINMESFHFNASTDNKARLSDILHATNFNNIILIIDEVHRMNKDIQDYLLPFVENGKATLIGLTTENPYFSVNYAIRSRVNIYEVLSINKDDIIKVLYKALKHLDVEINTNHEALERIATYANGDLRSAINLLEAASLYLNDGDLLTQQTLTKAMGKPNLRLDNDSNNFYLLLSGLQKSIRGSDVDASLFYLANLINLGDINSITRRLLVIAYEDIGLAQPQMPQKVLTAVEACKIIGLPEARIILAAIVVDMAISPKSNSAYVALDNVYKDLKYKEIGDYPNHIDNNLIKDNPEIYNYPFDSPNALNSERYLPKNIEDSIYYKPLRITKYEKALADRLDLIDNIKGIKREK